MIYLLDTNTFSDRTKNRPAVVMKFNRALQNNHTIAICQPVYYEVLRGLVKSNATRQIADLNNFMPYIQNYSIEDNDWTIAAHFWALVKTNGRHLSDMDILIAVVAQRVNAILVSSDEDFDALPIARENWRKP